jgi:hypothetical protein
MGNVLNNFKELGIEKYRKNDGIYLIIDYEIVN